MSITPEDAKYSAPQHIRKATRKRRRYDIYGGLAGGSASLTSRLVFDLVSNEALDLSTLVVWVECTGYNTNHYTVRPHSLFDFIELRSNSTTIESLRDLDELENLQFEAKGSVVEDQHQVCNQVCTFTCVFRKHMFCK